MGVIEGMLRAFLVPGSWLNITDDAVPTVSVSLDLHKCISHNSAIFKETWNDVWKLFAQLALNREGTGFDALLDVKRRTGYDLKENSQPEWAGELMIVLMRFPRVMRRCSIRTDTQAMFMDAVHDLSYVHVVGSLPLEHSQWLDIILQPADMMNMAAKAWQDWDYSGFGKAMGLLLREMLMNLPQKHRHSIVSVADPTPSADEELSRYSADPHGRLRKELARYSALASHTLPEILVSRKFSSKRLAALSASCAFVALVALVALQKIYSSSQHLDDGGDQHDNEAPFGTTGGRLRALE